MGQSISLAIDKYWIYSHRNGLGRNHFVLFEEKDNKKEFSNYVDEGEEENGFFSKRLIAIKDILELLGYSLKTVKSHYDINASWYSDYFYEKVPLTYKKFYEIIVNLDLDNLPIIKADHESDSDLYAYVRYLHNGGRSKKPYLYTEEHNFYYNINPYVILRILLENPKNHERSVVWHYGNVLNGGYINEADIYAKIDSKYQFLVVTEGSTDTNVIKKSLQLLNPELMKLFSFIDMRENYPFTGTGNLFNFVKGISKLNLANKVLILFDNDAEGNEKYLSCKESIKLPPNLRVTKLPELEEFNKFKTIGPMGTKFQNINGKAVSIECFLDLGYNIEKEPVVRWKNYIDKVDAYQGALESKDVYISKFLKGKEVEKSYNFDRLKILNTFIIKECIEISETSKISYDGYNYA